jgi:hypothetical protein
LVILTAAAVLAGYAAVLLAVATPSSSGETPDPSAFAAS